MFTVVLGKRNLLSRSLFKLSSAATHMFDEMRLELHINKKFACLHVSSSFGIYLNFRTLSVIR